MKMSDIIKEDLDHREMYDDFKNSLSLVFSDAYLNKINHVLRKNIKIKEKDFNDPSKASYVSGRTIFINTPVFEKLNPKQRTDYLLHEFIHVIQNTRNFFVLKAFKEVFDLGNDLYKIARRYTKRGGVEEFLTGNRRSKIGNPRLEIVSYLMNGSLDWTVMSDKGREKFIETLKNTGMFNLRSPFWNKRLI